ncbi:MAG TPA: SDR family oxidoreductase [Chitinophagaceae bacterium]|jgi:NAD(P)-dependent dehydrogenase (short-subunit alcohol dehydrogenase family)|nr:SDR family oxidoreductase [Chitinophagaceae bacterium]
MEFKQKTVVITGGAKGIGAACAKLFFEAGAQVAVLDLVPPYEPPEDARWLYLQCNVSDSRAVEQAMEVIWNRFGSIHFLVNNAGIQRYGSVTETPEEEWDLVMNVNLKSCFLCSKYALPYLQRSGGGAVINIASVQAFVTQEKVAAYAAAKSALLGLTRSIAIDFAPLVRCVAVCPGTIDTPMLHEAIAQSADPAALLQECEDMHLSGRIGQPAEVAALVHFLCSKAASFITGEAIRMDGGLGIRIGGSKQEAI